MATFLTLPRLRAHAVPALPLVLFDPPDRGLAPPPVLVASWHAAADGRLVCRWRDIAQGNAPPPD